MKNPEVFYPLGTVVKMSKKDNPVVIIGRLVRDQIHSEELYDYVAVDYIMGIQTQDNISFFNNADITGILFVGMQNEEELDFQEFLLTLDKNDY